MALTKVGPKIAPVLTLALFVLGGMAVRDVTNNTPAFNEDLIVPSVTGEERLYNTVSMYDYGTYLMQIGYGYLNSDAYAFVDIGNIDGIEAVESPIERLETVRSYFQRSLEINPANPYTWVFYAQVSTIFGEYAVARDAIMKSWELAPYTRRAALLRLIQIELLNRLDETRANETTNILIMDRALINKQGPFRSNT